MEVVDVAALAEVVREDAGAGGGTKRAVVARVTRAMVAHAKEQAPRRPALQRHAPRSRDSEIDRAHIHSALAGGSTPHSSGPVE